MPENGSSPWVSRRVERARYAAYLAKINKCATPKDYLKKMDEKKKLEEKKEANQQADKVDI